jgi:hypothetical protein
MQHMATVPESCRVLASNSRAMQSRAEEPLTDSLVWERVKGETGLGKGALRLSSVSLRVLMLKLPFRLYLNLSNPHRPVPAFTPTSHESGL